MIARRPDVVLERARAYLASTPEDEERVRQGIGERLANESGVHSSEPPSGPTGSRAAGGTGEPARSWPGPQWP